MAVTFDSYVKFAEEDSTTPTSTDAWTIASTADRFVFAGMFARDFGTMATHNGMTVEGVSMTQQGSAATIFGDGSSRVTRWSLINPTAGSSMTLAGSLSAMQSVGLIAGAVYNGVDQTTPISSTPTATENNWEAVTEVTPHPAITATTVSGGKLVALLTLTSGTGGGPSSVTGTGVTVHTLATQNGNSLYIVEKDDTSGSTTIDLTVTFGTSGDGSWRLDGYALQPPASSGFTVTAESGTYNLTGQTANTLYTRIMAGGQGTYSLTGVAALLVKSGSFSFVADPGAYTLVGSNALVDLAMNAAAGTYTLTGQAATVTYAPLSNPTLTANAGTYALTGRASNLLRGVRLTADRGIYSLTGRQAGLLWSGAPTSSGYVVRRISISSLKMGI